MADSRTALKLALRLIGLRSRSKTEIKERLERKGFDEKTVRATVAKLERSNLLNDERFTKDFINSCLNLRRYGRVRILFELKKLGIENNLAENELVKLSHEEEFNVASSVFERYRKRFRHLDTPAIKRRLAGLLQRRGFPAAIISRLLKKASNG